MARKLDLVTPDIGAIDSNNPDGTHLNEGPGDPGTPLLAEERNSIWYFFSRVMSAGSVVWNGIVDNFTLSQYFDALVNFFHGGEAVDKWDSAEAAKYEAAGYLVQDVSGKHYTSTGKALNENKDPADPANSDYWFPSDGAELLEIQAKKGLPVGSGMHNITNRAHADFAQNILVDKIKKGAVSYNEFMVMLDGTVVTGNATLEAIFDVGGANEYPYLDLYAPDVVGTRTLLDMGERVLADQSESGENDVIAEILEDRFQGFGLWGRYSNSTSPINGDAMVDAANIMPGYAGGASPIQINVNGALRDDGVNGAVRVGLTTRPKELTRGISYIVVMRAA
ncbi:hypothetical protein KAR91_02285 [Candidatus Pacearchaeota archaeon]|nr:hypothetical protein [Candidatus Pacearchaeota archaeon]